MGASGLQRSKFYEQGRDEKKGERTSLKSYEEGKGNNTTTAKKHIELVVVCVYMYIACLRKL